MRPAPRILLGLCVAELFAMSLWFTGTTALPQLARIWHVPLAQAATLTTAVQFGFVVGALAIAITNLADVCNAARVFAVSALLAAAANAAFALLAAEHRNAAIALRFVTGAALAGVYPVGMKILASWFREGRGFALGALVGALTLGTASTHFIAGVQAVSAHEIPWRSVALIASALAVAAAAIVAVAITEGPFTAPPQGFRLSAFAELVRNRRLLLANLGYLGHMWEVYSMWAWIAVMFSAAAPRGGVAARELAAFAAIGIGAIGSVWAGRLADRDPLATPSRRIRQRAWVAVVAMCMSACCCVLAALAFHHYGWLILVSLLWGASITADSAQFSAIISEVADQQYVGTALTLQTALGFLLTTVSIRFAAGFAAEHGWPAAMAVLAAGPVVGIAAMLPLARNPIRGEGS